MKRLLILFALLDFATVLSYVPTLPSFVWGMQHNTALTVICLIMLCGLTASGYGLLQSKKWAFILSYGLFPARLALGFLSLAWVAWALLPNDPSIIVSQSIWGIAATLEGIRLGLTVGIHAEMQKENQPSHGSAKLATPDFV